jgi:hypothetical protein
LAAILDPHQRPGREALTLRHVETALRRLPLAHEHVAVILDGDDGHYALAAGPEPYQITNLQQWRLQVLADLTAALVGIGGHCCELLA